MKAPSGLMIESALADFHALRQGFSPPARTVEHYNAEQLPILTILKTGINCAFNVPPRTQHLPWQAVPGRAQSKNILGVFHFS